MLTVRVQQNSYLTWTGVLVKVSKVLRQKMSRPEGGLEPPTFGFMPNALTYWAIRARHLLPMFVNTGSGSVDIFKVKLSFEMLTVRGQQHSFSTHERVVLWKCQSFWDRKCLDLRGTRTPNLRASANTVLASAPAVLMLRTGTLGL